MNVTLAVLADYSNITREGKLNILGIFDIIWARNFPAVHPSIQLVMRFEAPRSEVGINKNVQVRLIDGDGHQIFEIGAQFTLTQGTQAETVIKSNHILNLNNLTFQRAGDYAFHILVNGEEKNNVPLKVMQVPQQQLPQR